MAVHELTLETSWDQIYDALHNYFRKKGVPPSDRDDLVQEVLMRAVGGKFKGHSQFLTFVFGIANNVFKENWRIVKRTQQLNRDLADLQRVREKTRETDLTDAHLRCLEDVRDELSPKAREIIYLFYWEKLPLVEVAAKMGMTEVAVKQLLYRFRKKLDRALREHGLL